MSRHPSWIVAGFAVGLSMLGLGLDSGRSPLHAAPLCPTDLAPAIDQILDTQPAQRAQWGILVAPLEGGEPLYGLDAERFFIPASNVKLLVTAAALTRFGADYRVATTVYAEPSAGETVLRVVGQGDPSLTDASLQSLAQQVQTQIPTQIDRLIVDDTYFWGDAINPNWEWEDLQAGYGPPVNSLMLNLNEMRLNLIPRQVGQPLGVLFAVPGDRAAWQIQNFSTTVPTGDPSERAWLVQDGQRQTLHVYGQLQVGSEPLETAIAVPDPTQRFLRQFEVALQQMGVTVQQTEIASEAGQLEGVAIAQLPSPPFIDLITEANTHSENLYAEALLHHIGASLARPQTSTLEAGLAGSEQILATLGVAPDSIALADGSGLARKNLATPSAVVATLQGMHRSSNARAFRQSLAIAGSTGTLRNRFRDTPVQGRLYAKTGALSGVAALSGYLDPPNYPPVAISILVNHFDQAVREIRPSMDEIVLHLADLQPCP
jgi:D-alanyl-D-alanine carboxypeptidase/D-alanyl-D-alanine-endopeptidase (penicillin-binding protein 4)